MLGAWASLAVAQETSRIGYVDMKRLIDNAPQMLAARERLRVEFDARDAEITAEIARLATLDARLRDEAAPRKPFKSIKGLWADLGISLSSEEIDANQREMWKNFPREDI